MEKQISFKDFSEKYKKEYNEGFVLSPSEELDDNLMNQVKQLFNNKYSHK